MWIYKEGPVSFYVGYIQTINCEGDMIQEFQCVEEYDTKEDARKAVNYLNGGSVIAPNPLP